jgi:hypothetical protein
MYACKNNTREWRTCLYMCIRRYCFCRRICLYMCIRGYCFYRRTCQYMCIRE